MIEVQNVTKYYGRVCALDSISFGIKSGEIVGLLGPNGSGKTTLMRILTGFFPATEGDVRVAGLDVATSSLEVRSRIGYLPENVVLYPDMSVQAFLNFCAQIKIEGTSERHSNVERVLSGCALEEMARRQIGTLSKGYRQRVGLAQALLGRPEVLILDEPTIGLDPNQVIGIRELIKDLGGHSTVLLSSHILHEVELTCERVIIVDKGHIIAEDTAENLSARVQGATKVLVRADGPTQDILAALRALQEVSQVTQQDDNVFTVHSSNQDIAREIAQAVINNGWNLHELRPVTLDLESLFVRLTGEEHKEQQEAA
jgi:ABC-2 type transport system ATP-binding protein